MPSLFKHHGLSKLGQRFSDLFHRKGVLRNLGIFFSAVVVPMSFVALAGYFLLRGIGPRSTQQWVAIAQIAGSIVQASATIVGGAWVYRRFIRQREEEPRLELELEIGWLGLHEGPKPYYLAHLVATVSNTGMVTHRITCAMYRLRFITAADDLTWDDFATHYPGEKDLASDQYSNAKKQVTFPHPVPDTTEEWSTAKESFIQRQTSSRYFLTVAVPADATFVMLTSVFTASDGTHLYEQCVSKIGEPSLPRPLDSHSSVPL